MRERGNRIIYKNKSGSLLLEQTSLFRKEFLISRMVIQSALPPFQAHKKDHPLVVSFLVLRPFFAVNQPSALSMAVSSLRWSNMESSNWNLRPSESH